MSENPYKKKRRKRKKIKIPDRILIFKNKDKSGWHEVWKKGRNKLNIPHPYRGVLLGPPNRGKTNMIFNIIIRAKPKFMRMVVFHCNPDYTHEYDDFDCEMLGVIPPIEYWDGQEKTIVIFDDVYTKKMNKESSERLSRLFGNLSTHNNISVLLCSQDPFEVPPIVRRCSNLWVLWKMEESDALSQIARKCGIGKNLLYMFFDKYIKDEHDCIWIDKTKSSPYPIRLNGFTVLSRGKKSGVVKH